MYVILYWPKILLDALKHWWHALVRGLSLVVGAACYIAWLLLHYTDWQPTSTTQPLCFLSWYDDVPDTLVHCCTLSLCYLGAETDDDHRNPNINKEII